MSTSIAYETTPGRVERIFPIRINPATVESSNAVGKFSSRIVPILLPPTPPISRSPLTTIPQFLEDPLPSGARFISNTYNYVSHDSVGPEGISECAGQKLYSCEDEPIHVPGAIQNYGVLVALRQDDLGYFVVRIVSDNSQRVCGVEPEQLFSLRCFTDLLSTVARHDFISRVQCLRRASSMDAPDIFSISLLGTSVSLFCAMHINTEQDLIICELELEQDLFNPRHSPDSGLPERPLDILGQSVGSVELEASTVSKSGPLHAVNVARRTERDLTGIDLFRILSEIQKKLSNVNTLPVLLEVIVGLVYELTSFHRCMVYQLDENAAGCVKSEIVDPRASADVYRGLHFPASDIPPQARRLYEISTIRVLYDRDQPTARLLCRTCEDAHIPLDLRHSYLRAMSPFHLKYLANMGVRASMSISLLIGGKLWGLISCHGYGPPFRVSSPVREVCRALGNLASSNIERLIYAQRVQCINPFYTTAPSNSPSAYIAASSTDLLSIFSADFGFLAIKNEARVIGKLLAYPEAIAILRYLRYRAFTRVFYTNNIERDCADIGHQGGFKVISGLLVVPLTPLGTDFLVFMRKGVLKEVNWAGNPYLKEISEGNGGGPLEPRSSFRIWKEYVVGTSQVWTENEVGSAQTLGILYGRLLEVWRQKEAIVQRNRMTRVLIRNAGHEARTPLNSIINYLEVALEEILDENARQHLQNSLIASKSLMFAVNDLLNLTEAEDSLFDVRADNVNLRTLISEVVDHLTPGPSRVLIKNDEMIPSEVRTDGPGLRQVISNLLGNAIEHGGEGPITMSMKCIKLIETYTLIRISFEDQGEGLSEQELDTIFQDFEKILDDSSYASEAPDPGSNTDKAFEESPEDGIFDRRQDDEISKAPKRLRVGLGLAITARFVRLHHGQIFISSEGKGTGSTVSIEIPFRKALLVNFAQRRSLPLGQIPLPTPAIDLAFMSSPSHPVLCNTESSEAETLRSPGSTGLSLAMAMAMSPPISFSSLESPWNADVRPSSPSSITGRFPFPKIDETWTPLKAEQCGHRKFSILMAEDNPLNRLLEMRLLRRGHSVKVAVNGQVAFEAWKDGRAGFDVVFMDMQMPLISGAQCTRLIRSYESKPAHAPHSRIPIIALSASLREQAREEYIDMGLDGWILKPVNFKRLEVILAAVGDEEVRRGCVYKHGEWSVGGWFF